MTQGCRAGLGMSARRARAATLRAVRLPDVIPIKYEPDYRPGRIGRHARGQFFADITGAYPEGVRPGHDWQNQQRTYVVLHLFTESGHHTGSNLRFTGVVGDRRAAVEQVLSGWLAARFTLLARNRRHKNSMPTSREQHRIPAPAEPADSLLGGFVKISRRKNARRAVRHPFAVASCP
jgi:hypothetical protein